MHCLFSSENGRFFHEVRFANYSSMSSLCLNCVFYYQIASILREREPWIPCSLYAGNRRRRVHPCGLDASGDGILNDLPSQIRSTIICEYFSIQGRYRHNFPFFSCPIKYDTFSKIVIHDTFELFFICSKISFVRPQFIAAVSCFYPSQLWLLDRCVALSILRSSWIVFIRKSFRKFQQYA